MLRITFSRNAIFFRDFVNHTRFLCFTVVYKSGVALTMSDIWNINSLLSAPAGSSLIRAHRVLHVVYAGRFHLVHKVVTFVPELMTGAC